MSIIIQFSQIGISQVLLLNYEIVGRLNRDLQIKVQARVSLQHTESDVGTLGRRAYIRLAVGAYEIGRAQGAVVMCPLQTLLALHPYFSRLWIGEWLSTDQAWPFFILVLTASRFLATGRWLNGQYPLFTFGRCLCRCLAFVFPRRPFAFSPPRCLRNLSSLVTFFVL